MAVTVHLAGRMGNLFLAQSFLLAYAKKWGLDYVIPSFADAYRLHAGHTNNTLYLPSTGVMNYPINSFEEANIHTEPSYQDIPFMDNTIFMGYWQSFKYFDWCRDYILEKYNFSYNRQEITSIHYRMGDCLGSINFPIAPIQYYQNAVKIMQEKGYNEFKVFSDNIPWCKVHFNTTKFPHTKFTFSEGKSELSDYIEMQGCINNITARSTYSLTAAWINPNKDKIVLVPSTKRWPWWKGMNKNLLTDTGFTEVDFTEKENLIEERTY